MTPTYHIVSHSHWDREWSKTFEQFRSMLVGMVDDLLTVPERDPAFRRFTLDGQTLRPGRLFAVRPEKRRVAATADLVRAGCRRSLVRLPDEFLVSAEATVRNLGIGWGPGARD